MNLYLHTDTRVAKWRHHLMLLSVLKCEVHVLEYKQVSLAEGQDSLYGMCRRRTTHPCRIQESTRPEQSAGQ